ncbi:MAG: VCBS repeat-containing protein [Deltaproteobacteria bacterium]|nr:VCBS repeat-containing protein [Deltaproteobacteria bacterium]
MKLLVTTCVLLPLLLGACHRFKPLGEPGCGNGVLEPALDEDCDFRGEFEAGVCGARESAQACRYLCDDDDDCPAGWACGGDGVCRAASGSFQPASVIALPGSLFAAADVDGDGLQDVVSFDATEIAVAFGDAEGRFLETRAIPAPPADEVPVVSDFDGDGAADVALPLAEGVQLFRGGGSRELIPIALPGSEHDAAGSISVLAPRLRAPFAAAVPVVLVASTPPLLFIDDVPVDADAVLAALPPGALVKHLASGDLDADPSPDELVLAAVGGDAVVVAVVAGVDLDSVLLRQRLLLPAGERVDRAGVFLADADADDDLDLYVALAGSRVALALNDGAGTLAFDVDGILELVAERPTPDGELLAAGDIDGDGRADLVGAGVFISEPGQRPRFVVGPTRPWSVAAIVDANNDGAVDVIGGRPGIVDVLLQTGDGTMNTLRVPISGSPAALVPGDFDGDLVVDVAVLEAPSRLVVLFANASGVPALRVVSAELPVGGAALGSFRAPGDGIDDLFAAVPGDVDGAPHRLVRLQGTSAQRMVGALPTVGPVFASLFAGRFGGTVAAPGPALVVVDITQVPQPAGPPRRGLGFRVVEGDAVSGQRLPAVRQPVADAACALPDDINVLFAPVDLDDDGVDEVLLQETISPVPGFVSPAAWRLFVLHPGPGGQDDNVLGCRALAGAPSEATPRSVHAADVDGDGVVDAIVALDPAAGGNGPPLGSAQLAVWWGDASAPDRLRADPELFDVDVAAGRAFALTPLELDGDSARELLVHDGGSLLVLELSAARKLRPARALAAVAGLPAVSSSAGAAGVTGVPVVNDVDGDGLDDVLIGAAGSIFLLKQAPCTASQAELGSCARPTAEQP